MDDGRADFTLDLYVKERSPPTIHISAYSSPSSSSSCTKNVGFNVSANDITDNLTIKVLGVKRLRGRGNYDISMSVTPTDQPIDTGKWKKSYEFK
ncbi:hypothetical protein FACS1894190_12630 [Spirochaetia bacterium]|nr:hypothetical protein FACS1894190_12630 [Spirochaetia bacterium]